MHSQFQAMPFDCAHLFALRLGVIIEVKGPLCGLLFIDKHRTIEIKPSYSEVLNIHCLTSALILASNL